MSGYQRETILLLSVHDMACGYYLSKAEAVLKNEIEVDFEKNFNEINYILEIYNIKEYIENNVYLKSWTQAEIDGFKVRVKGYGVHIGRFFSKLNDGNVLSFFDFLIFYYEKTFWKLINDHKVYKKISPEKIELMLNKSPRQIDEILKYKNLVSRYGDVIYKFLLSYSRSAEILLSIYEVENKFNHVELYLPEKLSNKDKEDIISDYIDSEDCNYNYLSIIQNSKKRDEFRMSDKIRLRAKRKQDEESSRFFNDKTNKSVLKYGVSISYIDNAVAIKECRSEGFVFHYSYDMKYIERNSSPYFLYLNFKYLFEYIDHFNRINLISKRSLVGLMEGIMGVRSKSEYFYGIAFNQLQMSSQAQIHTYSDVLKTLGHSLENILQFVYTSFFSNCYGYADNASLTMPTESALALEKVRTLAPELESVLKQYKLFVEEGQIDFELLQISSGPSSMRDIPSLNEMKYIYVDEKSIIATSCLNLFFSDQTMLAYVEPFKEKKYGTFFNLLSNEKSVLFSSYENYQLPNINYLIDNNYIYIDELGLLRVVNVNRILILKDLYENETASFYHYPIDLREEVIKMISDGLVFSKSTLFSKPEQDYFNYYLNKSEFTNGLDLRNSYLHGTQANPSKTELHENNYYIYMKLLVLVLLKIEDDLFIFRNLVK